jgi:hypothetical protein
LATIRIHAILVETESVEAWREVIRRCSEDKALLEQLRRGIYPPRGMDAVVQEMVLLYERRRMDMTDIYSQGKRRTIWHRKQFAVSWSAAADLRDRWPLWSYALARDTR